MDRRSRVTSATLDVLEVLVDTPDDAHGFTIAQTARRPTGSVYPILARLESAGWLDSYWEDQNPREGLPRRCFYCLQPDGLRAARTLLAEGRPKQSRGLASRLPAPDNGRAEPPVLLIEQPSKQLNYQITDPQGAALAYVTQVAGNRPKTGLAGFFGDPDTSRVVVQVARPDGTPLFFVDRAAGRYMMSGLCRRRVPVWLRMVS
jgi:PadR family transcriptional regulator PadR